MPGQAKGKHPAHAHIAKMREANSRHAKDMEAGLSGIEGSLPKTPDPQMLAALQKSPGDIPQGGMPGGVSPLGGKAR